MQKKAVVISTEKEIIVRPILKTECTSCMHGCEKTSIEYAVLNPKKLSIKKGDLVKLDNSLLSQTLSGLISLFFPFLSSIAGFFLAGKIAGFFNTPETDGIRAACVLSFLAVSSLAVFVITRLVDLPGKLVITDIEN